MYHNLQYDTPDHKFGCSCQYSNLSMYSNHRGRSSESFDDSISDLTRIPPAQNVIISLYNSLNLIKNDFSHKAKLECKSLNQEHRQTQFFLPCSSPLLDFTGS